MEPTTLPPPPPDPSQGFDTFGQAPSEPAGPQQPGWRRPAVIVTAVVGAILAIVLVSSLTRHEDPSAAGRSVPSTSGTPNSSPAASLDQRFAGDGVTIKLPQGWKAGPGFDTLPQAMQDAFAGTAAAGDSVRLSGYGSGAQVNILMIMTTPSGGLPLHSMTDMVIAGVAMGSGSDPKSTNRRDTTVDGQDAEQVAVEIPGSPASMVLYTWVEGDQTWMAMWIGLSGTDASATYDRAMASLTTSAT